MLSSMVGWLVGSVDSRVEYTLELRSPRAQVHRRIAVGEVHGVAVDPESSAGHRIGVPEAQHADTEDLPSGRSAKAERRVDRRPHGCPALADDEGVARVGTRLDPGPVHATGGRPPGAAAVPSGGSGTSRRSQAPTMTRNVIAGSMLAEALKRERIMR